MTASTDPFRPVAAEALATFLLVLASAGAVVVDQLHPGTLGHTGCCMAAGLIVMAMIYSVGDVSGAHINPAVTLGFWWSGRFPLRRVPAYLAAQLVGSLAAGALLLAMFPQAKSLGATIPAGAVWQSFLLEIVLTCMLMYVILSVATGAKEKGIMAGIAIGGVVLLNCLWGGPISGAAMNPARTFGPSLLGGDADSVWIYLLAPIIGAALAVPACRLTHPCEACCEPISD